MKRSLIAVSMVVFVAAAAFFASPPIGDAIGLQCGAAAQPLSAPEADDSAYRTISKDARFCSFLGYTDVFEKRLPMVVSTEGDITSVEPLVETILTYSGVEANINVYSGRALNAAAVLDEDPTGDFERFIIYNPQFFPFLNRRFRSESSTSSWATIGVLAHEVGHHLAEHTLEAANQRYFELQADWYSGYILGKMGADLDDAQSVLKTFWRTKNSKTHPENAQRLAALSDGWRQSSCEAADTGCLREFRAFEAPPPPEAGASTDADDKIEPEFVCTIGGEQLFVAKGARTVHWLRHFKRRYEPVGAMRENAGDQNCPWRLEFDLSGDSAVALCGETDAAEKLWFTGAPIASLLNASDAAGQTAAKHQLSGRCLPCGADWEGLCPDKF